MLCTTRLPENQADFANVTDAAQRYPARAGELTALPAFKRGTDRRRRCTAECQCFAAQVLRRPLRWADLSDNVTCYQTTRDYLQRQGQFTGQ